ncbi:MAG: AMP-binding protein [Phycisphaerales bacterium]|jgi:acyl-CoA synthetase (AMP-forming)/AMP-acid ligase II/1-acyl-sn-glycerol-3-phosphate acyltransferase/acyl carrier protein|nr:AMP-binding protein [Phycisphaerales bacterium]
MLDRLLIWIVKCLLKLRYRIRVKGLDKILEKGDQGILFLPNHPALIDPVIMLSTLKGKFAPRALADQDEIDLFFIRWISKRAGIIPIPSIGKYGRSGRQKVKEALAQGAQWMKDGGNMLLYPAGHLCRTRLEDIGGSSAVETLLDEFPKVRIVLAKTTGLWGSGFGYGPGTPYAGKAIKRGLPGMLASGLFFMPRRKVTIEFFEPDDVPRDAGRETLNRYLENFYNQDPPSNTHIPYSIWRGWTPRHIPEPEALSIAGDIADVPDSVHTAVCDHLTELTGSSGITNETRLAHDLGLDSLARVDLATWLDTEFGHACNDPEALHTAGDVMLAACGQAIAIGSGELKPVPPAWFTKAPTNTPLPPPTGETVAEEFLKLARKTPGRTLIADQLSGAKTYRDIILGVMALRGPIERLEGDHIGIMLPASVGADIVYLATIFAGKIPVMVNWTVGPRNLVHSLELTGVKHVLTAKALVAKLKSQGVEFDTAENKFTALEDIGAGISLWTKLRCLLASRLSWKSLEQAKINPTAAVLFTSGSESLPKAVPLSHANLLASLGGVARAVHIGVNDHLIGILPPFHSFGLTGCMLTALAWGARVVYHANPTEAETIGRSIEAYETSIILGTPTFLGGIVRASTPERLAPLRMAVTGAEKCSDHIYQSLQAVCPDAVVMEGYGVTECSPFISINDPDDPKPGTIGKVLDTMEYAIIDIETDPPVRVEQGKRGMLIVRGANVFDGYLHYDGASPFMEFQGHQWYRTGDLVTEDPDNVLTFAGRLKRFVKIGGEMISLPAIEAVLTSLYAGPDDQGPILAVTSAPGVEPPELVLMTTFDADRGEINQQIRAGGLSGLHSIRQLVRMDEIPLMGTGKTDYRALDKKLADESD